MTTWGELKVNDVIRDKNGTEWRVDSTVPVADFGHPQQSPHTVVTMTGSRTVSLTKPDSTEVELVSRSVVAKPHVARTYIGERHQEVLAHLGNKHPVVDDGTALHIEEEQALEHLAPLNPTIILPVIERALELRGHLATMHNHFVTQAMPAEEYKHLHNKLHAPDAVHDGARHEHKEQK